MKKIMSVIAALTLVLAMGLNVCAAPSVSKLPGVSAGVKVTNTSSSYVDQAREAGNIGDDYNAAAYFHVSSDESGELAFDIAGVKDGDSIIVMYNCPVHGWQKLTATVSNGQLVVNFTCCATVNGQVVVFVKTGAASPKTADAGVTTAAVVAMIAIAGLAISKKKFA